LKYILYFLLSIIQYYLQKSIIKKFNLHFKFTLPSILIMLMTKMTTMLTHIVLFYVFFQIKIVYQLSQLSFKILVINLNPKQDNNIFSTSQLYSFAFILDTEWAYIISISHFSTIRLMHLKKSVFGNRETICVSV